MASTKIKTQYIPKSKHCLTYTTQVHNLCIHTNQSFIAANRPRSVALANTHFVRLNQTIKTVLTVM